ncbi:MAG TPA: CPCC family cysteine-rich protein [Acidobacteriaceae bacterium]|jgi:hypothetical protein
MTGMTRCPCCGFRTLHNTGELEICPVCYWQDDGQPIADVNTCTGGPNNLVTLAMAQSEFGVLGASDLLYIGLVREPLPSEH